MIDLASRVTVRVGSLNIWCSSMQKYLQVFFLLLLICIIDLWLIHMLHFLFTLSSKTLHHPPSCATIHSILRLLPRSPQFQPLVLILAYTFSSSWYFCLHTHHPFHQLHSHICPSGPRESPSAVHRYNLPAAPIRRRSSSNPADQFFNHWFNPILGNTAKLKGTADYATKRIDNSSKTTFQLTYAAFKHVFINYWGIIFANKTDRLWDCLNSSSISKYQFKFGATGAYLNVTNCNSSVTRNRLVTSYDNKFLKLACQWNREPYQQ